MRATYRWHMFDAAGTLSGALATARDNLAAAASATSRTQTRYGSTRIDAAMAGVAQSAVFTEALLSAVHARLAEIKSVTRS